MSRLLTSENENRTNRKPDRELGFLEASYIRQIATLRGKGRTSRPPQNPGEVIGGFRRDRHYLEPILLCGF